ncbi:hypothetical protein [Lysobacter auxotrophicus]|uniref:DUF2884 family protein n=1 Tax=Lysobacter auxotrophicus TaxID=2992573 RepID=A0ABM8DCH9_9GAMM|nr:hypothetical protein [Lysobacter auxotrophicus]BDU16285.1 DUF2884 family protein [Lysobacter auxotrophicus]
MTLRLIALTAALSSATLLAACDANPSQKASQKAADTGSVVSGAVQKALTKAKKEIAEGNISVNNSGTRGKRVEISPKGDLLIDGQPVPVTPQQRTLLLEYRGHVIEVANAGVTIGMHSADLATQAVTQSLKSVFTGGSDEDIERNVKAQASKVEDAAMALCDALPGMMESQNRLAAAMPEFKPYANMTQADIDECRTDAKHKGETVAASAADAAQEAAKAAEVPTKQ